MGIGFSVILLGGGCLLFGLFLAAAVGIVYYLEQNKGKHSDH
jgi:hypothetical protein